MVKFVDLAAEYKSLWETAVIRPEKAQAVKAVAQKLRSLKPAYDEVAAATNVQWYIVGLIHSLESTFNMEAHLHNGDPLSGAYGTSPKGPSEERLAAFFLDRKCDRCPDHAWHAEHRKGRLVDRADFV